MNDHLQKTKWAENVILVDVDYTDKLAFHLITNFERMLERPIPCADFAQWIECVAIDGGLQPLGPEEPDNTARQTQVILIHGKDKTRMENFVPSDIMAELNGRAFNGKMGEFLISAYPVEDIADGEDLLTESLKMITTQKEVKRVMVVPNAEDANIYNKVREALRQVDGKEKGITVFVMNPSPASHGRKANFCEEILGYSLLAALGIKAEEIEKKICKSNDNQ